MPKLPTFEQEPIPLFPVIEELDGSGGVVEADLSSLPEVDPEQRITIGRLASAYGKRFGPADSLKHSNRDTLLDLSEDDFKQANPHSIVRGLNISRSDQRFHSEKTEQLVRVAPLGETQKIGVVFPADEFKKVARSSKDLAYHMMAGTRAANRGNTDRIDVEGKVGRSAAHIMEDMIKNANKLESGLQAKRSGLLIPLYRETKSVWRSHFKAKNLDKKRKEFDEDLHYAIDTATINLNLGTTAVKSAHRAAAANLYRRGSSKEINAQWRDYVQMMGEYVSHRISKVQIARSNCGQILEVYQPFLDQKTEAA